MPLQRRVPKFGFKSHNRVEYKAVNLDTLQELAATKEIVKITPEVLADAGLVARKHLVKILGRGSLNAKIDVEAHAFSKSAEEAITSAGGTIVKL